MKLLNRQNANITSDRPIKVLQFGTGNFLRGFVDWVIDILNEKTDFHADVQIVQPHGRLPAAELQAHERLVHVMSWGLQYAEVVGTERLITSVRPAINFYLEYDHSLAWADEAELRFMVSNPTEW